MWDKSRLLVHLDEEPGIARAIQAGESGSRRIQWAAQGHAQMAY